MKTWWQFFVVTWSNPRVQWLYTCALGLGLWWFAGAAMAADDLLAGTTDQALATMNGSGRYWLYILEFVISIGLFAKTRNPYVFFSVVAVALAANVVSKMAGGH